MNNNNELLNPIFEALAHEHRREIIYTLGFQPQSISQLASQRGLSLQAMHKHIKVLEKADLIIRKKSGRVNFIALNKKSLMTAQSWLMQYNTHWGSQKETLQNYVAGIERHGQKTSN